MRNGLIGFTASGVSDIFTNCVTVLNVYRMSDTKSITY